MSILTLASQSATRVNILRNAGASFEAYTPVFDEGEAKHDLLARRLSPMDVAAALAELKALAGSRSKSGLVIGADQTLDLAGDLLDKAESLEQARERLLVLRGRTHALHAGVAVAVGGDIVWRETRSAFLTMRDFSDAFLDRYLERSGNQILSSVGCYQFEGEGVQLFQQIDGDYFTILGLPLLGLLQFLRKAGALAA